MLIDLILLSKISSIKKTADSFEYRDDDDDEGENRPLLLIALWLSLVFTWPVLFGSLIRETGRSWPVTLAWTAWAITVPLLFQIYTLIGIIAVAASLVWFLAVSVWATT